MFPLLLFDSHQKPLLTTACEKPVIAEALEKLVSQVPPVTVNPVVHATLILLSPVVDADGVMATLMQFSAVATGVAKYPSTSMITCVPDVPAGSARKCPAGLTGTIETTAAFAIGPPVAGLQLMMLAFGCRNVSGQMNR